MPGVALFLFACSAGGLILSALTLLLVGRWIPSEVLQPVWLSMLAIPAGLSFTTLIPYRNKWAVFDAWSRLRLVCGCALGLAVVHWAVVGLLLLSLPNLQGA